jgi:hypothetical protein
MANPRQEMVSLVSLALASVSNSISIVRTSSHRSFELSPTDAFGKSFEDIGIPDPATFCAVLGEMHPASRDQIVQLAGAITPGTIVGDVVKKLLGPHGSGSGGIDDVCLAYSLPHIAGGGLDD